MDRFCNRIFKGFDVSLSLKLRLLRVDVCVATKLEKMLLRISCKLNITDGKNREQIQYNSIIYTLSNGI